MRFCLPAGRRIYTFAASRAARLADGDARLSLEERYPGGSKEVAKGRRAVARQLVRDCYILARDEDAVAEVTP